MTLNGVRADVLYTFDVSMLFDMSLLNNMVNHSIWYSKSFFFDAVRFFVTFEAVPSIVALAICLPTARTLLLTEPVKNKLYIYCTQKVAHNFGRNKIFQGYVL